MSRDDVEVSVVPADCTPGWRDLPALAWVAARAYSPEWAPAPLARVLAACSLLVWLPGIASLQRRGQLVAAGRSAVVGVQPLKNPRALMWALRAMVLVFIGGSVLIWNWLGASAYLAALVLVTPCWLPLLMLQPWRVIRSQQAIERVYAGLQASDPGGRDLPARCAGGLATPATARVISSRCSARCQPGRRLCGGLSTQQRAA